MQIVFLNYIKITQICFIILCGFAAYPAKAQNDAYPLPVASWTQADWAIRQVDATAMISSLSASISRGESSFIIPPGDYYFPTTADALALNNLNNFTITASGATFWVNGGQKPINIANCNNVTISGLVIDYYPMPYIQGTITNINPTLKTMVIQLGSGFPTPAVGWPNPSTGSVKALFFSSDATGVPITMRNPEMDWLSSITPISGTTNSYTVSFVYGRAFNSNVVVGDILALPDRNQRSCVSITNCTNLTFQNMTLYGAAVMAFAEWTGGGNNRYINCKVVRRAGTKRALASNADVFHSAMMEVGPTITNCTFSHAGDDLINIHGYCDIVTQVTQSTGSQTCVILRERPAAFQVGTVMDFRDLYTLKSLGTATASAVTTLTTSTAAATFATQLLTTFSNTLGVSLQNIFSNPSVLLVTLSSPVAIPVNSLVYYPGYTGAGAAITNNTLSDTIANAILVGGTDSTITGNTIMRTGLSGISVGTHRYWLESRFPSNVTISGNILANCGVSLSTSRYYNISPGAISLLNAGPYFALGSGSIDGVVRVFSNTISSPGLAGIFAANLDNGTSITGNFIDSPCQLPQSDGGKSLGVGYLEYGINLVEPGTATISGNTITNLTASGNCRNATIATNIVSIDKSTATDIIMDNGNTAGVTYADKFSSWYSLTTVSGFYRGNYLDDGALSKGSRSVTFVPPITQTGDYNVYARWPASSAFSSNVPYEITDQYGSSVTAVNQQQNGNQWNFLGTYSFIAGAGGNLVISNAGTTGRVVVDGVRFTQVPIGQWNNIDVGVVGLSGSSTYSSSNGLYTISGAGLGVGGTSDSCQFCYQRLTGDGTIIARISSWQAGTNMAGIMIRNGTTQGAAFASLAVKSDGTSLRYSFRASDGETSNGNAQDTSGITIPIWLKLSRVGSSITAYRSPDGIMWTTVGTRTVALSPVINIGMAVASGSTTSLKQATLNSIATVPDAAWFSTDVGVQQLIGSSSYNNGAHVLAGSGGGMGGSYDRCRMTYTKLTGDGSIVARVTNRQAGMALAGIMMRDSVTVSAAFASLSVKSDGTSLRFLSRPINGGSADGSAYDVGGITLPIWLKLARSGNTFTSYRSTDGVNWTSITSRTATLSATTSINVGLVAASGQLTTLGTASFDNVTIGAPAPIAAVSRKSHGTAGTYDLPIPFTANATIPTSPIAIESRNGPMHSLIITFDKNVVSGQAAIATGTASLTASPTFTDNTMHISLSNVANGQTIVVSLTNLTSQYGSVLPNATVAFRTLTGDADGNASVTDADVTLVQSSATSGGVTALNFRQDINANGVISTSDVNLVRAAIGAFVP